MGHLSWVDITTISLAFVAITLFGHRMAGLVDDRRSFFSGSGSLPWLPVSASIIATTLSAVTFISVPAGVFRDGGNLGYAQVVAGFMIGTALTVVLFVRPYYECKEAETTFDYVSLRLTDSIGRAATGLGLIIVSLSASAQLLTSGLVLSVILDISIPHCVLAIVGAAVVWSAIGGIKTVIWTDVLLYALFLVGAVFSAIWTFAVVGMSWADAIVLLDEKAKLVIIDISTDPKKNYTLWAGLIGGSIMYINVGTWQSAMQRVRACRSLRDAKKAYYFSIFFYLTPIIMLIVGLGLTVFYHTNELGSDFDALLVSEPDRIFPYFVVTELPIGISSLLIVSIFSAGISTLDSRLTEVTDVAVTSVYQRYVRTGASERHYLLVSRIGILIWGAVFGSLAILMSAMQGDTLLNLTFKMPGYFGGALIGTFLLARIGVGTGLPYAFGLAGALSTVLILDLNGVSFMWWYIVGAFVMISIVWTLSPKNPEWGGLQVLNASYDASLRDN